MEFYTILLVIHTILVLFLIGIVLIQRSDSDGLSGLGGGGGGGGGGNQFLTGRGSANLLTRTTAILAGIFMFTSMVLAVMVSRQSNDSIVDSIPMEVPAPSEGVSGADITEGAAVPDKATKESSEPMVPKPE